MNYENEFIKIQIKLHLLVYILRRNGFYIDSDL